MWVGDHIAFAVPILDPLQPLAQAAVVSRRLTLATGVYLLPLHRPTPVAKQVATLDHLTRRAAHFRRRRRRRVPQRIRSCGVSIDERVARLTESIAVLRKLWSGETASHHGRFFSFEDVRMLPPPRQVDGPPIWCGGRSEPVLRRAGQ